MNLDKVGENSEIVAEIIAAIRHDDLTKKEIKSEAKEAIKLLREMIK